MTTQPSNAPKPSDPSTDSSDRAIDRLSLATVLLAILAISAGSLAHRLGSSNTPASAGGGMLPEGNGLAQTKSSPKLPDFQLIDSSGRFVSRSNLLGRFVVLNFVFTGCSAGCLETSHRMAEIQSLLKPDDNVKLVSMTVDPRTDTPETLARFARRIKADPERWTLLTGDKAPVNDMLTSVIMPAVLAPGVRDPLALITAGRILVIDPEGAIRASLPSHLPSTATDVLATLESLKH